jgi:tetratricopeptide (TPR) repeat protein
MINILDFNIRLKSGDTFTLEVTPRDASRPAVNADFDYPLSYMTEFEINQLDVAASDPEARVERLRSFGTKLYRKIFNEEVERRWQEAKDSSSFLVGCIRIAPEAAGLEALPWETMFDGEEFIAVGAKTGMSRLPLDIPPQNELAPVPLPLKMLAVISSPLDLDDDHRLQIEREQEILLQAVNTPAGRGRLQVDFEDEAKLDILESSLEVGYQILHFTGHGISPKDGGGLLLEDAKGESRATATTEILQSLQKAEGALRLAVISGCQTARTLHVAGFRDLARGLAHRKVPAVIAMQFSISDAGGLKFAEALYPKLVEGRSIEEAMSAARRTLLHSDDPYLQGDALAPVLIAASGRCLQTTAAQSAGPQATAPSIDFSFHLPLARLDFGFYGRRRDYRLIRDGLIYQNHRAVIVHGIGGIGKTALISHAAGRLRRHFRGVYAFDCTGGALAPERILLDLHRYLERQGIKALESLIHQPLPPEELANYLAQVLSQWPLLLIFDNFETHLKRDGSEFQIADAGLRAFVTTLVKATATGTKFLFTSRYLFDLDKKRVGAIQELSLGDLSRPEALGLMQKLPRLAAASYDEKLAAFETFGGHPYALVTLDRYCGHSTLAEALKNTRPVQEGLRGFLAIELNYSMLSDRARDLLNRLAAFRGPVSPEAAEWVIGENIRQTGEFPRNADRSKVPEEWKALDEAALLEKVDGLLLERRRAQELDQPISELIDWGLLTPMHDDGELRALAVHSLVRDFCRERLPVDDWRARLRDAAAFYTNETKLLGKDNKTPAAVWSEIEAFELLMEAQDYGKAVSLLVGATELLARWGFGGFLEVLHGRVMPNVGKRARAVLLHNLGILLAAQGEYAEALAKYDESLRILEELGNRAGVAKSLFRIGLINLHRGDYDEALAKYEASLRIEEEIGDRGGAAESLHEIGIVYEKRGKYKEALAKYKESLGIKGEIGNRLAVAGSLGQLGTIHHRRGEYREALAKYEESLRILEELGDQADQAEVATSLQRIGMIREQQGEYDEALAKYEESLGIYEELGDRAGVAMCLHGIGMIYEVCGEPGGALAKYEQSLKINQELGDREGVAISLHQIGNAHYLRDEYVKALANYEESIKIKQELGYRAGVASSLGQIGMIHGDRGEYDEALAKYEESLAIDEELGHRTGGAISLHQIGNLYYLRGEYDEALAKYEASLRIKEEIGDRAGAAASQAMLGQVFRVIHRYGEALGQLVPALATFTRLRSPDARIAKNDLKKLRGEWGPEKFDPQWEKLTGEDTPNWLK